MWLSLSSAYPQYRWQLMLLGLAGASLAIVMSAFATQPWHLVVTLGLIYPMSGRKRSFCQSVPSVLIILAFAYIESHLYASSYPSLRMVSAKARIGERDHVCGHWSRRNSISLHCSGLVADFRIQGSNDQSGSLRMSFVASTSDSAPYFRVWAIL